MKFPKATREAIHEAEGRPVEIDWPTGDVEPKPHRYYSVQSSHRAGEFRIVVLFVDDDGERAIVRVDNDPVRLLGKSGGYSSAPARAMSVRKGAEAVPMGGPQFRAEVEPEAVSEDDQLHITALAHAERAGRVRALIAKAEEALRELQEDDDFVQHASKIGFQRNLLRKLEQRLVAQERAV